MDKAPVAESPKAAFPQATSKTEMQKIIEAYKVRNPKKYELKKEELAKKLAALK